MTAAAPSLGTLPISRRGHATFRAALRTPSVWVFGLLVLAAVAAPLITSYSPTAINLGPALSPPSTKHWFGTDGYGMDVYTRVVYGARRDLLLALAAASLAAAIGVPLGAISAYFRGPTDSVLQRLSEMLQSFPVVLLAMAVLIAVGASLTNLAIVIAVINAPVYLRISRSVVLPLAQAEFVDAARLTGNGSMSIIGRHLLPNVIAPTMAQFTITFAWAIQIIAGLSFLGLGVHVPEAEWGLMVQQGSTYIVAGQWWPSFFPGLAIFIAVLTLNRVGAFIQSQTGAQA